ncbi:MAG: phosphatase PAP2 family protein [Bacteroidota bacterium]
MPNNQLTSPILEGPYRKLKPFLRSNRWFFIGFCILLLIALTQVFARQVGHLVLLLNQHRSVALDHFFVFVTRLAEPIAYLLCALILALFRLRSALFTGFIALAVGLVAMPLKLLFNHPRPLAWFCDYAADQWELLIQFDPTIYLTSWSYTSFPSGHAMSAFALYSFMAFNFKHYKWLIGILCLALAAGVGLSRIYLLMHFLRDVALGGSLGVLIGVSIFFLQFKLWGQNESLDKGLLNDFGSYRKSKPEE